MENYFTLGKKSKFGEIDFSKLKSGITKQELGIEEGSVLASIFDSIDENKEGDSKGKLDRQELNKFIEIVKKLAGKNPNLSTREAKKYNLGDDTLGKNKKELLLFIGKLSKLTQNVNNINVKENSEVITYEDGHTEEVFPDGAKIITVKDGNKTIETKKDKDGNITEENITDDNKTEHILYEAGSGKPKKKTVIAQDTESVTIYSNGSKIKTTTTNKKTGEVQEFEYVDGKAQLKKQTIPNGNGSKVVLYENGAPKRETTTSKENNSIRKSDTIYDGNNLTEEVSVDEKPRYQRKVIDGKEYKVSYDESGNTTGVIVQYGESIKDIAEKFGVTPEELVRANAKLLAGGKRNFSVGDEIVIPQKMNADEYAYMQADRKDVEGAKQDYRDAVAKKQAAENEAWGVKDRVNFNKPVKCYFSDGKGGRKEYNGTYVGHSSRYKGRWVVKVNNKLYIMSQWDNSVLKEDYVQNPEKYKAANEYNKNVKAREDAEGLAEQFYKIADENAGITSMKKMQELLDTKITSKNIVAFLDAYDRENTKKGDSSIIDTVTSEVGAGGTKQQRKVLMTILDKLCEAAKEAGVSDGDIQKARQDFVASLNKEFNAALRRTNPKDMEKAIDFLRGAIAAKLNNEGQISEEDAINEFKSGFGEENDAAQKDYKDAREKEGWTAKVGDTVCGWFGCNTIEDMDKKLGKNAEAVKKLASSKTEAEFKKNYKEIFGIEFDKNKIAARQTALEKYQTALNCNSVIKSVQKSLQSSGSYSNLRNTIKENFQLNDNEIENIINAYATQLGYKTNLTDEQKKECLIQFLQEAQSNATQNYIAATNGKTLEQMKKDIDLITRSAFGTNDIVKDVIQFNENQETTEMVSEAAFEIAGTIALQFVPGLGQVAAARLAVTAARWGTKAIKVVKYANKAEKAFAAVNNFQKGKVIADTTRRGAKIVNNGAQIAYQMVNAGVATATVDLTDGKSVKEATKKALMNMSFAGVGASSSILAPKLMQIFGIADKALATEIAEEIINAAGTYGVTKFEGGDYGQTDAFIDFATGLIMSRLSHIKSGKAQVDVPTGKAETGAPKTEVKQEKVHPSEDKPKYVKPKEETPFEKATRNSNNPDEIAPARTVGKLSNDKFQAVKENLADELKEISSLDNANLETLQKRIDALQNREQRRELQKMLDSKKEELSKINKNVQEQADEVKPETEEKINDEEKVDTEEKVDEGVKTESADETAKSDVTQESVMKKYGYKIGKMYYKAEKLIAKVVDLKGYHKALNYINTKFAEVKELAADLKNKLAIRAKKIGLKLEKAMDNASSQKTGDSWINSFAQGAEIHCTPNQPIKATKDTHIRLANRVDIDLKDIEQKLNSMKDGDSFIIGRTVSGANDIQINHPYISGQHIKIEKINGEIYITDLSSSNGTVLNTIKPDYAAQWKPDIAGKFDNTDADGFYRICDKYYDDLRLANYSYADSVNPNIRQADIMPDNYIIENKFISGVPERGWFWRTPKHVNPKKINIVDRISLNVKADKNLIRELDELVATGVYTNKAGQKVKVDIPDAYYKTPQRLDEWGGRHDPITMYFSKKISKELEQAIAEITEKYARKPINGKALMNSLDGKPWIAHEAYTPAADAQALYEEARRLNPKLASGIASMLGQHQGWNCSTGMYAAAKRLVDEYKLSKGNVRVGYSAHGSARAELEAKINSASSKEELDKLTQAARQTDPSLLSRINERRSFFERIDELEKRIGGAKTEKELNLYLDSVNKLPNSDSKNSLLNAIEEKRKSLKIAMNNTTTTTYARNTSSNIKRVFSDEEWNWQTPGTTGFRRKSDAVTNVGKIAADDVLVNGTYTGFSRFSGKLFLKQDGTIIDTDIRDNIVQAKNSYSVYNEAHDLTIVGIKSYDNFRRPGIFNIIIKGQVSEADAKALLDYIESKNLFPKDSSGNYSTAEIDDIKILFRNANQIQKEVVNFFNNLI